jgi:hypothetical protein
VWTSPHNRRTKPSLPEMEKVRTDLKITIKRIGLYKNNLCLPVSAEVCVSDSVCLSLCLFSLCFFVLLTHSLTPILQQTAYMRAKKTEKTDRNRIIVTEILLQSEERYREKRKRVRFKMNTETDLNKEDIETRMRREKQRL